jgi:hypothetical protein
MRLLRSFCIAAALAGAATATAVAEDVYAFELGETHPAALKAWQAIVPAAQRGDEWLYEMKGTATPIKDRTLGGVAFLGGFVCKPHDCGDNNAVFLIANDGSRAVGLLTLLGAAAVPLGSPTADEAALLQDIARE